MGYYPDISNVREIRDLDNTLKILSYVTYVIK